MRKIFLLYVLLITILVLASNTNHIFAQCTTAVTPTITGLTDNGGGLVTLDFNPDTGCTRSPCGPGESVIWYVGFYSHSSPAPNGLEMEYGTHLISLLCGPPYLETPIANGGDFPNAAVCQQPKASTCLSLELSQLIGGNGCTWDPTDVCGTGLSFAGLPLCEGVTYDVLLWEIVVNQNPNTCADPGYGIEDMLACASTTGWTILSVSAPTSSTITVGGAINVMPAPTLTVSGLVYCAGENGGYVNTHSITPDITNAPACGGVADVEVMGDLVTNMTIGPGGLDGTEGSHVVVLNCRDKATISVTPGVGCKGSDDCAAQTGLPACPGAGNIYTNAALYVSTGGPIGAVSYPSPTDINPGLDPGGVVTLIDPDVGIPYNACTPAGETDLCGNNTANVYPKNYTTNFGCYVNSVDNCISNLSPALFPGGLDPFSLPGVDDAYLINGVVHKMIIVCAQNEDPCNGTAGATCIRFVSGDTPLDATIRACNVTCTAGTGTTADGRIILEGVVGGSGDLEQDGQTTNMAGYTAGYNIVITSGPVTGAGLFTVVGATTTWQTAANLPAGVYTVDVRDILAPNDAAGTAAFEAPIACNAACPIELVIEILAPPVQFLTNAVTNPASCNGVTTATITGNYNQISSLPDQVFTNATPIVFPNGADWDNTFSTSSQLSLINVSGMYPGFPPTQQVIGATTIQEVCIEFTASNTPLDALDLYLISPDGTVVNFDWGTAFAGGTVAGTAPTTLCFHDADVNNPFNAGFLGDNVNGDWSLSLYNGYIGETVTVGSWTMTLNNQQMQSYTGITSFCAGNTVDESDATGAITAPSDLTIVPAATNPGDPAYITFTSPNIFEFDNLTAVADGLAPGSSQCYTVTGYLPGGNFFDGVPANPTCENGLCCEVKLDICFIVPQCFACPIQNPPQVYDYYLCEGASIPPGEGLGALAQDCAAPQPPFCPFDPTTMNITVCYTGTHTWVSDLNFYLQSPSGTLINLGPYANTPGIGLGNCNSGNNFTNLCFTNITGSGNYNVCTMAVPLTGTFNTSYNQAINWAAFAGENIYSPGWNVILGDCVGADVGTLTNSVVTISDNGGGMSCLVDAVCTGCDGSLTLGGPTNFNTVIYDSGAISMAINDNACTPATGAAVFPIPIPPSPVPFPAIINWFATSDVVNDIIPLFTGNVFQPAGASALAAGDYCYWVESGCGYSFEGDCAADTLCLGLRTQVCLHVYDTDAGIAEPDFQILCCGETINWTNTGQFYNALFVPPGPPDYELGYAITSGTQTTVATQADLDALPPAQVFMATVPDDPLTDAGLYTTSCTPCPGGTTGTLTAGVYSITPFLSVDAENVTGVAPLSSTLVDQTGFSGFQYYQYEIQPEGSLNNTAVDATALTITVDIYDFINIPDCTITDLYVDYFLNGIYTGSIGPFPALPLPIVQTITLAEFGTVNSNDVIMVQVGIAGTTGTPGSCGVLGQEIDDCVYYLGADVTYDIIYEPTFVDIGEGALCARFGPPTDFVVLDPICADPLIACNADGTYSVTLTVSGGIYDLDGDTYQDFASDLPVVIDGSYLVTAVDAATVNGTAYTGPVAVDPVLGEIVLTFPSSVANWSIDLANYDNTTMGLIASATTIGCPITITGMAPALPLPPPCVFYEICQGDASLALDVVCADCIDPASCPVGPNSATTDQGDITDNLPYIIADAVGVSEGYNTTYTVPAPPCAGCTLTSVTATITVANVVSDIGGNCNQISNTYYLDDEINGSFNNTPQIGSISSTSVEYVSQGAIAGDAITLIWSVNFIIPVGCTDPDPVPEIDWYADISVSWTTVYDCPAPPPTPATTTWYDMATAGTSLGTGTLDPSATLLPVPFVPAGGGTATTAVYDENVPGVYTFYAQCECGSCIGERTAVNVYVYPFEQLIPPADVILCDGAGLGNVAFTPAAPAGTENAYILTNVNGTLIESSTTGSFTTVFDYSPANCNKSAQTYSIYAINYALPMTPLGCDDTPDGMANPILNAPLELQDIDPLSLTSLSTIADLDGDLLGGGACMAISAPMTIIVVPELEIIFLGTTCNADGTYNVSYKVCNGQGVLISDFSGYTVTPSAGTLVPPDIDGFGSIDDIPSGTDITIDATDTNVGMGVVACAAVQLAITAPCCAEAGRVVCPPTQLNSCNTPPVCTGARP